MSKCPHCDADRLKHPNGTLHCNECGCCFEGNELREGHPPCKGSLPEMQEKVAEEEPAVEEEVSPRTGVTPIPSSVVKGIKAGISEADAAAPEDTATPERRVRRRS